MCAAPRQELDLGELQGLIDRLALLALDQEEIEWRVLSLLRANGVTWESLGKAQGVSRQTARNRYHRLATRFS